MPVIGWEVPEMMNPGDFRYLIPNLVIERLTSFLALKTVSPRFFLKADVLFYKRASLNTDCLQTVLKTMLLFL